MLRYPAILHQDGNDFWVEFPDFPEATTHGALAQGDNPVLLAQACLADAILFRLMACEPLPDPSSIKPEHLPVSPALSPEQATRMSDALTRRRGTASQHP